MLAALGSANHGRNVEMKRSAVPASASHSDGRSFSDMVVLRARAGFGGLDGVLEQAGDRHRADPARDWRDCSSDSENGIEVNIAGETVLGARRADIDHDRARLDHRAVNELRRSDACDQHISAAGDFAEITGARVTGRHGRVLREQQGCDGPADKVRTADNHSLRSGEFGAGVFKQNHHAARRTRHERVAALHDTAGVQSGQPVDVLLRGDQPAECIVVEPLAAAGAAEEFRPRRRVC